MTIKINRTSTTPIQVPRTNRVMPGRVLTSLPAGKMVPLLSFGMLREDQLRSSRVRLNFEMMETAEILLNPVNVNVQAWFVPFLAFERFARSMDILNRSYKKQPPFEGEAVIPFLETAAFGAHGDNDIMVYLGKHGRPDQQVSTAYVEAYNAIWNFRAKNRSDKLHASAARTRLQANLAPAFWKHDQFAHIVPDFDQAKVDGEVPLNVTQSKMMVQEIWGTGNTGSANQEGQLYWPDGVAAGPNNRKYSSLAAVRDPASSSWVQPFVEMQENGITVSLANIEMAKKTAAFATLRQQYSGHPDEWIIDMMMDGISVPDQAWTQPMLMSEASTVFGMGKRYASDGANLTKSVVNGATFVDMSLQLPRCPTGGVVMVVAEITPEQLFERQKDPFLHTTDVEEWPEFIRDHLDPEKVEIVPCDQIDIDHNTPTDTFGYAPMNFRWNSTQVHIGGRYYRPDVDAGFDEDRLRLWAVETANPTLTDDFYICNNIHTKPFVVTNQDPFEVWSQGDFVINGLTQFGPALMEASDDYEKVLARAPQERIDKEA